MKKDLTNEQIYGEKYLLSLDVATDSAKSLAVENNGKVVLKESGNSTVSWDSITNKPSTFPPTIGNTATTAKAGNTAIPAPATTAPLANGTATVGTSTLYARQDHVHPLQTTVSGNAGTATALATGRTFTLTGGATGASAAFNGTANATIAVTLAAPTSTVRGGLLKQPAISNLGEVDLQAVISSYNTLLGMLRNSGLIDSSNN